MNSECGPFIGVSFGYIIGNTLGAFGCAALSGTFYGSTEGAINGAIIGSGLGAISGIIAGYKIGNHNIDSC